MHGIEDRGQHFQLAALVATGTRKANSDAML
jgi:hypothetical protein